MEFKTGHNHFYTLIVGAGPAGTGPLVNAMQRGELGALLESGICIVDRTAWMGRGSIGQYVINSDTFCNTFLECLQNEDDPIVQRVSASAAKQAMDTYRGGPVPLKVVGDFISELGAALRLTIDEHPSSQFIPCVEAKAVQMLTDGRFQATFVNVDAQGGEAFEIIADNVVLAMGASQSWERTLQSPIIPGLNLAGRYADKAMLTNLVLSENGSGEIERRLQGSSQPKVVIIGASHSTTSSAWLLLNKVRVEFGEGDITILHREPFRIFYPSREAALEDGYTDFTDDDFCPSTNRLYRLAGLRFDSRELIKQIWGMGGTTPEKRVRLIPLDRSGENNPVDIEALLYEADIIIPAFGYRSNTVPIHDANGERVELMVSGDGAPPLVDDRCRVLDAAEQPIPNLYGIGLASGFRLTGKLGGEPSFRGQTNGLWLYQNGVGELILDQVLAKQTAG
jgi:hypothetical protein